MKTGKIPASTICLICLAFTLLGSSKAEADGASQTVETFTEGQEYRTVIMDVELDDNTQALLQVGQAASAVPVKLEEIHSEKEALQEGLRVALVALSSNGNLTDFNREGLLEAISYFDKASSLSPSVHSELSRLLISCLLLSSEPKVSGAQGKTDIMNQLNGLAFKYKNRAYERTLVYHVQGVLFEVLFSDPKKSQMLYSIVRASPYKELVEDFFDTRQNPVGYPRQKTTLASYKDYILPLFVYSFLREQYEGKLPVSTAPADIARTSKRLIPTEFNYLDTLVSQEGRNVLEEAATFFQQNEYLFLRNFLSKEEVTLLGDYYSSLLIDPSNNLTKQWDSYLMRWTAFNDRIGFFLAKQKEKLINNLSGNQAMKMSYSFFCSYTDEYSNREAYGGRPNLRAHTHRKDNEITVSIPVGNYPIWPINLHVKRVSDPGSVWREVPPAEESIEFHARPGDAVIFMGRYHTNWREGMPADNHRYDELLLHYVHSKFDHEKYRLHDNN